MRELYIEPHMLSSKQMSEALYVLASAGTDIYVTYGDPCECQNWYELEEMDEYHVLRCGTCGKIKKYNKCPDLGEPRIEYYNTIHQYMAVNL